jgi:CheY-like chemotaxis protein
MTILYIDDDPEDREFFQEALSEIHPSPVCITAKDGAEGLRLLNELVVLPDFIFADVNMPIMSGKQFLIEIKRTPAFNFIPVIIYSTTNYPAEAREYQRLGAHKVLVKPASMRSIVGLVRSVIQETEADPTPADHLITGG